MTNYQKKEDLTLNTVEKKVVPAINELLDYIGQIDELETDDKTNLVNAINEVLRKRQVIDVLADVGTSGTLNPTQVLYLKSNTIAGIQQGPVRLVKSGTDGTRFLYSTVRKKHEDEEEAGYRYQYIWVNMETGEWTGGAEIISGEGGNISVWDINKTYESGEQVYQYDADYDTYNYYYSKIDNNMGHPPVEDTAKAFWVPCTNEITHTQYKVLPEAGLLYLDRIFQYIGETNDDYTNGRFYKCIKEESAEGVITYKWEEVSVGGEETELEPEIWRFTLTDGTTQDVIVYVKPDATTDLWTFTTETGETFTRAVKIKQ